MCLQGIGNMDMPTRCVLDLLTQQQVRTCAAQHISCRAVASERVREVRALAFNLFKQALAVMVTDEERAPITRDSGREPGLCQERLRFARALGKELWFTEAQAGRPRM